MAHKRKDSTMQTVETNVVKIPGFQVGDIVQVQSGERGLFVLDDEIHVGGHASAEDFKARGWAGLAYVRRANGKRRYMALIGPNPNGTALIASIFA
jgi:hypothetical protein